MIKIYQFLPLFKPVEYFSFYAAGRYQSIQGFVQHTKTMAAAEIRRQLRVTARAWRKLIHRRISPATALRVVGRSCWRIIQLLSRLSLLVVGGTVVAMLMIAVRLFYRLRRSK